MYKAFWVDKALIGTDVHFGEGCASCHRGNEKGKTKEDAHKNLVKRPSDDLTVCARCHPEISAHYRKSLHYTTGGLKHGVAGRFSKAEQKIFEEKVFEKSCRGCHASCGNCHVQSPVIGGVNLGLIKGHKFVRKDEAKTCGLCHGGRVYPEFTGEYGGVADVHYQKSMFCLDCHKKESFHGDGQAYAGRRQLKDRPSCAQCHPIGSEKNEKAKKAHRDHAQRVSCAACHASAPYRNCQECHLGKGAAAKPALILGLNPQDKKTITTLRLVPTVKGTFKPAGIQMEAYDSRPNYWDTAPHNIRKRTERTRSCDPCHVQKKHFLTPEKLIPNGSKANEGLVYQPRPVPK